MALRHIDKVHGTRRDVCERHGISPATLHRIENSDPNAPRPFRLPTGGVRRNLKEWDEYFQALHGEQVS